MPAPAATLTAAMTLRERGRIRVTPPDPFGLVTLSIAGVSISMRTDQAHCLLDEIAAALTQTADTTPESISA